MGTSASNGISRLQAACESFLVRTASEIQDGDAVEKQLGLVVSTVNDDTSYPAIPAGLPWRTSWVLHGALLEHTQNGGFTVARNALLRLLGSLQLVTVVLMWLCAQRVASSKPLADLLTAIMVVKQAITTNTGISIVTIDDSIKPSQLVANVFFAIGLACAFVSMCMNLGATLILTSTCNFTTFKYTCVKWGTMINASALFFKFAADCVIVAYVLPMWAVCFWFSWKIMICMQILTLVAICIAQSLIMTPQPKHMGMVCCLCLSKSDIKYHCISRLLGKTWAMHPAEVLAAVKGARDLCDTITWLETVKPTFLDDVMSCIMCWPTGVRVEQQLAAHCVLSEVESISIVIADEPTKDTKHGSVAPCHDVLKPLQP